MIGVLPPGDTIASSFSSTGAIRGMSLTGGGGSTSVRRPYAGSFFAASGRLTRMPCSCGVRALAHCGAASPARALILLSRVPLVTRGIDVGKIWKFVESPPSEGKFSSFANGFP